jgi:predicted SAM-dependent methyltransferase
MMFDSVGSAGKKQWLADDFEISCSICSEAWVESGAAESLQVSAKEFRKRILIFLVIVKVSAKCSLLVLCEIIGWYLDGIFPEGVGM